MTFAPTFTITNRITADLTTIERARGFLEAATISKAWVQRMSQRALLLEAHHTTHIEGTQLSVEQAAQVWAGQNTPKINHRLRHSLTHRHKSQALRRRKTRRARTNKFLPQQTYDAQTLCRITSAGGADSEGRAIQGDTTRPSPLPPTSWGIGYATGQRVTWQRKQHSSRSPTA